MWSGIVFAQRFSDAARTLASYHIPLVDHTAPRPIPLDRQRGVAAQEDVLEPLRLSLRPRINNQERVRWVRSAVAA